MCLFSCQSCSQKKLAMLRRKHDDIPSGRVVGHGLLWTPGKVAQSLLLPYPVKVLCHWTGTLRTTGRKRNLRPQGTGFILRIWTSSMWAEPLRKFPPTPAKPALGRIPEAQGYPPRIVPIALPHLATAPPNSWCSSPSASDGHLFLAPPAGTPLPLISLPTMGAQPCSGSVLSCERVYTLDPGPGSQFLCLYCPLPGLQTVFNQ